MIILGIDPGIATTGWGVIEKNQGLRQGHEATMQDYGCIYTDSKLTLNERLVILYQGITDLLLTYKPEAYVVEELFFNTNAKTALVVGHARGVILLAAGHFNVPFFEYTPLQVKVALSGYGRADKAQMQRMVKVLFGLDEIPKPDDAADALAIAYTHAVSIRV